MRKFNKICHKGNNLKKKTYCLECRYMKKSQLSYFINLFVNIFLFFFLQFYFSCYFTVYSYKKTII